jgi:hypothetical protein
VTTRTHFDETLIQDGVERAQDHHEDSRRSPVNSYTTTIETSASTDQVLAVLTDPRAIRSWSPVPFELEGAEEALRAGSATRVSGSLAGLRVGFDVRVHAADIDGIELSADGPVAFDVRYGLRPADGGSEVSATVSLKRSRGLTSRLIGKATEALLAAGALDSAAGRIARAAETTATA